MVLAPALTACSSITTAVGGGGATAVPSASLVPPDRALHALDGLLDDSLAQVQPALTYWDGWPRSTEQAGGIDDHSLGYATAGRDRHIMTKIAPAKYATPLAMAGQSWKAKGYTVATPAASPLPSLAASTPDGHSLSITIHDAGNITIGAAGDRIPVIRDHDPFGTPTPDPVTANGNLDVIPTHDDPFWSH
ncbi:hypothetical protein [Kitasatospora sp. MAA19]|uniref:hypothetical protein n=1 Tax=Kitasatospora sp. MAA19 TaxID=3035090 RepID=UPI0024748F59|nr:hypothetical protein [Kitasatospora sp. MAA19]